MIASVAALLALAQDVTPLLLKHCASCHRPGQVAPFSLLAEEDATPHAAQIAEVTAKRYMPPWKAANRGFAGERRLTQGEIDAFGSWAKTVKVVEPDLILEMPEPFTIPADGPDIYRCFVIPLPPSEVRWVRAIEFEPGNRQVVHHALFFSGKPSQAGSYSCFGSPGFLPARGLGGWSPGNGRYEFPPGTGVRLRDSVVLQIHYHPSGKPETDRSRLKLSLTDRPPTRQLFDIALGTHAIDIPAGERRHIVRDHFTVPVDVEAVEVIPHMHYVGKAIRGWAVLPTGKRIDLLRIDDWDFTWQDRYRFKTPLRLPAGTEIEAEFIYDNTVANVRNPNSPPKRVKWGLGVEDEMAGLHLSVIPVRKEDGEELGRTLWGKMMRMLARP